MDNNICGKTMPIKLLRWEMVVKLYPRYCLEWKRGVIEVVCSVNSCCFFCGGLLVECGGALSCRVLGIMFQMYVELFLR